MRLLSFAVMAQCAAMVQAAEPKLPANMIQPQTAFARATKADDGVVVTLKLPRLVPAAETRTVTYYVNVEKIIDGKKVVEKQPVTK
jgi:hypothetical protein